MSQNKNHKIDTEWDWLKKNKPKLHTNLCKLSFLFLFIPIIDIFNFIIIL